MIKTHQHLQYFSSNISIISATFHQLITALNQANPAKNVKHTANGDISIYFGQYLLRDDLLGRGWQDYRGTCYYGSASRG